MELLNLLKLLKSVDVGVHRTTVVRSDGVWHYAVKTIVAMIVPISRWNFPNILSIRGAPKY